MAKLLNTFKGQTFVKVKPTDNRKAIEDSKKMFVETKRDLADLKERMEKQKSINDSFTKELREFRDRLSKQENITQKNMTDLENLEKRLIEHEMISQKYADEFDALKDQLLSYIKGCNQPRYDMTGMDHFWSMDYTKEKYILTTIPNAKGDIIIQNHFPNLEEISKEYRSFEDIFTNAEFIGKVLHNEDENAPRAYVLYDFEEGFLGYTINDENRPIGPALGLKGVPLPSIVTDESIPELNTPRLLYRYVEAFKRRG